ncbi:MAG: glycosyltransferase family 4 protein [Candidatus Bathyarchaeota archaeon]|nr:glycosyltransferase family 4 protein [Candidatus Bathyarchaeota archaeon]
MKILMLSDFYHPIIGGLERHVKALAEELIIAGYSVTVCTIKTKWLPTFEEQNGVKIIRIDGFFQSLPFLFADRSKRYHPPIQDWLITRKLKRLIEEIKPDIIHAHGWILHSVLPLKKRYKIPLIVTLHDYGLICPKKIITRVNSEICSTPLSNYCITCGRESYGLVKSLLGYLGVQLNRRILKHVDKFIAVSQYVRDVHLINLGLNEDKITVIPNFYKEEKIDSSKRRMLPDEFMLFVGSLRPDRGLKILIDAYKALKTKTKLVIIGTEHPKYSYTSTDDVTIIANATHELVMTACNNCNFLIIPSIIPSACPTVAFEAMSCKKAIIGSDIGGLRYIIINGVTGFLIPPLNTKALAEAMSFLIENPQISMAMGKKGWELFQKQFSLNSILPRLEQLYEELHAKNEETTR